MKKCIKCEIVFHVDDRTRCLYCNSLLTTVEQDDDSLAPTKQMRDSALEEKNLINQVIRERKITGLGAMQYIIGSYFRIRALAFMYSFCRSELKMGKGYKRFFVQPLNISSFLTLPWVAINFIDSLFFRVLYARYCPECGWKYYKTGRDGKHEPEECSYNKEYEGIVIDILTGDIAKNEAEHKKKAIDKIRQGHKSAYDVLCSSRSYATWGIDLAVVWISIATIVYLFIYGIMPLMRMSILKIDTDALYLR